MYANEVITLDDLKGIDPNALTQAALGVRFSGGENVLEVQQGQMLLDGAKLDVLARVPDVAAGRIQAQIRADRFDLDRYLPLLGEPSPRTKKSTKLDLERPLGLGDLAKGESSYVFKAGQLKARGVVLKAVEASWSTDGERLRASLGRITSYNVCYTKLLRHRWVMGSGETLADAKRMCRAEAVREIVELAGVVVESVSEVEIENIRAGWNWAIEHCALDEIV